MGPGSQIVINGSGFGTVPGSVDACDCPSMIVPSGGWTNTQITAYVYSVYPNPSSGPTGVLQVETNAGSYSNTVPYIALAAQITKLVVGNNACTYIPAISTHPCQISQGSQLTIYGNYFGAGPLTSGPQVTMCNCANPTISSWDPNWTSNPTATGNVIVATAQAVGSASSLVVYAEGASVLPSNPIPYAISTAPQVVNIQAGANIPSIVASYPGYTTFMIAPGTYQLNSQTGPIVPKNGDSFIGQTSCTPTPSNSTWNNPACPAVISGSENIGALATYNSTYKLYEVKNQTQAGTVISVPCMSAPQYSGCSLPEDLWFDGVPQLHINCGTSCNGGIPPALTTGQWWFDYTNHIIWFPENPSGHTVETSIAPYVAVGPANNVTFQYLTMKQFAVPMMEAGLYPDYNGTQNTVQTNGLNWVISNSEMWGHHSVPIAPNYGTQVLNSYLHNNGQAGMGGGTSPDNSGIPSGLLVYGNQIIGNNYANVDPGYGAGGIKFGRTFGAQIRQNVITNNEGAGIHFDVSSSSPVIVNNTVTDNLDGDGIAYEISWDSALVYNNILQRNGAPGNAQEYPNYQLQSSTSTGMNAYCNVMEMAAALGEAGYAVNASQRVNPSGPPYGDLNPPFGSYPPAAASSNYNYQVGGVTQPGEFYVSTGNYIHHNTVIWDATTTESYNQYVGYFQLDALNQPNFFADNTPPNDNTYHLYSPSTNANFVYDNNNSQDNTPVVFATCQKNGADVDGSADSNNASGFPRVAITSPPDGSSYTVNTPVTVSANASDGSGINKVEFYADWNLQSTLYQSPFNFTWTATLGEHTLATMAYSKAGIRACNAITVSVSN